MKKPSATPVVVIPDPSDDDLPEGWRLASIKDIADVNPRHPKGVDDSMPVSFAPMAALSEDGPAFVDLHERPYGAVRKGFTHFGEGDVLFAKITPCMENGKGAVATGLRNRIGCGTTELHVLRPHREIEALYLYRFLSQQCVRRDAKETFTSSAGQARVPTQFIENLEIPIPPLAEQKRIVAKVEELLARVNAAREGLAKVPAILKRFRQSVLAAACSGRLTGEWRGQDVTPAALPTGIGRDGTDVVAEGFENLPETWRLVHLDSLLQTSRGISYGIVKPGWHDPNGIRLLKSQQVRDGTVDMVADFRITKELDQEYVRTRLQGGELLLNLVGASIGRSAIAPPDLRGANVSRAIAVIPVVPEMSAWVQLNLRGPIGQKLIQSKTGGSAQPVLNLSEVRTLCIPIPPLAEQQEIVRQVDRLFALADSIEKQVAAGTARAEKLTQSILAKAFRGELVLTETELARREGREASP